MQCLRPRLVVAHGESIAVPCGKCISCRINKKREWSQRLTDEVITSDSAYFVTLTYDDEHLPRDDNDNPCVSKVDCQKFFKRLRKLYPTVTIRYFLGSEYGGDGRPHYHLLLFNLPDDALEPCKGYMPYMGLYRMHKGHKSMVNRKLNDIWQKGFVTIGDCNRQRISYLCNYYVDKQEVDPVVQQPNFNLMSRRPGIGAKRLEEVKIKLHDYHMTSVMTDRGTYVKMPRYYFDKVYDESERYEMFNDYLPEHHEKPIYKLATACDVYNRNLDLNGCDTDTALLRNSIECEQLSKKMLYFRGMHSKSLKQ